MLVRVSLNCSALGLLMHVENRDSFKARIKVLTAEAKTTQVCVHAELSMNRAEIRPACSVRIDNGCLHR